VYNIHKCNCGGIAMCTTALSKMIEMSRETGAQEATVEYLAGNLKGLFKSTDKVLICFQEHDSGSISDLFARAVTRCGGIPVVWGPDRRWKSLLQQAFFSRATAIIGPPLVILGLAKLKKNNGLPLYIRHVITAGYPCMDWVIEGIQKGFDCVSWGSFGIDTTGVIAGFSCDKSMGVHLREDVYGLDVADDQGNLVPDGETGQLVLYPKAAPQYRYTMGERGRLERDQCSCGCGAPRVMDIVPGRTEDPDLLELGQYLHSWTSVLDCRLVKGDYGLEIELVVFPGEKMPRLPSSAKLHIRPWDPKHDEPFFYRPTFRDPEILKNHY